MSCKLVLTKIPSISKYASQGKTKTLSVLQNGKYYEELSCDILEERSLIGNIYVGKIKNIVRNIDAAFVEILEGQLCFLPLSDMEDALYTDLKNPEMDEPIIGDELLVQVVKDGVRSKAPVVTTALNFTGKYFAFTTRRRQQIGISNKLDEEDRERLTTYVRKKHSECGVIVRTNAGTASLDELDNEFFYLENLYYDVVDNGVHMPRFSLLMEDEAPYIKQIRNIFSKDLEKIITDDPDIYDEAYRFLENHQPEDLSKLRMYEDEHYSLWKLYNLETLIGDVLRSRVWLKSGGYLVIEPTEALTVIDVNTGKYDHKGYSAASYLNVNLDAASEIARQIRLRNLSGIILIDFINMADSDDKQSVIDRLTLELFKDPTQTTFIDMTGLELAEITRKKNKKPFKEQLGLIYDFHRNFEEE